MTVFLSRRTPARESFLALTLAAEDIRDTRRIDLIFLGGRMFTREQVIQSAR